MTHTAPDWGANAPKATIYSLSDLAELAARLGSIDTYERRGDVIFLEDFESGLMRWTSDLTGVGGVLPSVTSEVAASGFQSIKSTTPTGDNNLVHLGHTHHLPILGRIGCECAFRFTTNLFADDTGYFQLALNIYTGQRWKIASVRFRSFDLEYYDDSGNWIEIANINAGELRFHRLKFVVDFLKSLYVRAIFDNVVFLLSAPCRDIADTSPLGLDVDIYWHGPAAVGRDTWLDDFILTQNEPE